MKPPMLFFALLIAASPAFGQAQGDEAPAALDAADDEQLREEALGGEILEWERPPLPPFLPDPDAWQLSWGPGARLTRKDGAHELLGTARLLVDGVAAWVGSGIDAAEESGRVSDGDFRQARLTLQGRFFHRFLAKIDYEFAESEFRDFYVGARDIPWLGTVQFGYFREPFSLEQTIGRPALTFMERSLMNGLVPRRNVGVMATNTYLDRRLRWAAGAFRVIDALEEADDFRLGGDDWNLTARMTGVPLYEDGGRRLVQLGVSYSHSISDSSEPFEIAQKPESFLAPSTLRTGPVEDVDSADRIGFEAAWVRDRFSAQAETVIARVERSDAPSLLWWGGYMQASWFLTGEHRVYGRRLGAFGRVVPTKRFSIQERRWGALQLAARISYLDLTDRDVRGGSEWNWTLALNWHLNPSVRFTTNYVYARVQGQDDAHILQARLQFDL